MGIKEKIKILIKGVAIPIIIFVGISLFVGLIFNSYIGKDGDFNPVIAQGVADIFIFIIYLPLYIRFRKNKKLKSKDFAFSYCLFMIPLAFSLCLLGNTILNCFFDLSKNVVSSEVELIFEKYGFFLCFIIVAVLVPIIEEMLYRGFIYDACTIVGNEIVAIIVSSLLFSIMHGNIEQMIYALYASIFFSYVRYKYKSVIYTIILHVLMNLTTLVFSEPIILAKGIKEKAFIIFISLAILIITIYRMNYRKNI